MRIHESFLIAGMLIAIGLQACASGAPSPKPAVEPAARMPVAAMAEVAPAEATPADPAAAEAENPYPGTKMREGPNGETVYCKKEVQTGEIIAKERCYTAYAMEQLKQSKRDQVEKIRENSGYATGGT